MIFLSGVVFLVRVFLESPLRGQIVFAFVSTQFSHFFKIFLLDLGAELRDPFAGVRGGKGHFCFPALLDPSITVF